MKHLHLTEKDLETFKRFQIDNPHLFGQHAPDYSKQVQDMKKNKRADCDILQRKKMPQKANGSTNHHHKPLTPQQAKKNQAYMDKVKGNRPFENPITLQDANQIIEGMIQTFEKKEGKKFIFDDYNKKVIDDLTRYFMSDHQGPLDIKKGLWIYGQMGTGKTLIARLFSDFTRAFNIHGKFHVISSEDLAEQIKEEKSLKTIAHYTTGHCIDDAGQEGIVKIYGEKIDIIERIIKKAYFERKKMMVTSNLAPSSVAKKLNGLAIAQAKKQAEQRTKQEGKIIAPAMIKRVYEIESRYRDERTVDRIYEMFNFVPLFGPNKRRL